MRRLRHDAPSVPTWDDDDDDELVPPLDSGAAPDDDDAADGSLFLVERPSPLPAVLESCAPPRTRETRPRDPPRSIELPPPRHG
ncbi:MAG: hypothetical protein U0235_25350 [Polyangiaceae bacterium]